MIILCSTWLIVQLYYSALNWFLWPHWFHGLLQSIYSIEIDNSKVICVAQNHRGKMLHKLLLVLNGY